MYLNEKKSKTRVIKFVSKLKESTNDCISEGQNLQDCDLVINYDIHWNPVRLIQRFGRIDRLGSINDSVQLVNFWATDDLNKYLNLKSRVEARMALVDVSTTSSDNILLPNEVERLAKEELNYRDQQLLKLKDGACRKITTLR